MVRDQSAEVEESIWYLCYLLLEVSSEHVLKNSLYTLRMEQTDLEKVSLRKSDLSLVLAGLFEAVTETL